MSHTIPETQPQISDDTLLELRTATETAALAVGPWIGKRNHIAADQAAVVSLITTFSNSQHTRYHIAMSEGVKDNAPHLPHGAILGDNEGPLYDLTADPVEGTSRVAAGRVGGMVLAALAPYGTFPEWSNVRYMRKFVVGPQAAAHMQLGSYMSIVNDPREVMAEVAAALKKRRSDLRIAVLDRPRNAPIIELIRLIGARAILLDSGDVLPALQACTQTNEVDMLYGSGGAPETVLTAAAVAGLGGNMQAMWDPDPDGTNPEEVAVIDAMGKRGLVLTLRDLIGDSPESVAFSASGITDSPLLKGVIHQNSIWQPGTTLTVRGKPYPAP